MLKKIGIAVVVIIAVILVLASRVPDNFTVQRSTMINAKPAKILPQINDFHHWGAWDPWAKMDPSMKVTISGAPSGKGAMYTWEGNGKVGSGNMEILDSTPGQVNIALNFTKPMEGHDTATFTLTPQGNATQVTWAMTGKVPFVGKIFHLFMNMDKMVGSSFDQGLANLKAASEK